MKPDRRKDEGPENERNTEAVAGILLRRKPRHVARRICLWKLKNIFLEGSCLGFLGADLVSPNMII
jgi:hypothetical protein